MKQPQQGELMRYPNAVVGALSASQLCGTAPSGPLIVRENLSAIWQTIEVLDAMRDQGGTLYVCGNGGSMATAMHFVCDMAKVPQGCPGKPFKAVCLGANPSLLTAISNDRAYAVGFADELRQSATDKDVVMGISASGNSGSIVSAIALASRLGCTTIGLTGFDGGRLAGMVDCNIHVPENHYGRVEDVHLIICHMIAYHFAGKDERDESRGQSW